MRHRAVLVPLLAARLKLRPRADWLAELEAAKVPCGPINDLAEVFADPQVRERAMTVEMPHPLAGAVRLVASPIKLGGDAGSLPAGAAAARRGHRRRAGRSSAWMPRRSPPCANAGAI